MTATMIGALLSRFTDEPGSPHSRPMSDHADIHQWVAEFAAQYGCGPVWDTRCYRGVVFIHAAPDTARALEAVHASLWEWLSVRQPAFCAIRIKELPLDLLSLQESSAR